MNLDEHQARRYLLGELSEAEETTIEAAVLADAEALTSLELAEDELFEACARDELSAAEKARFAARFLAGAEGRRRLAVTRGLVERAAAVAPAAAPDASPWWRRPWISFALAAAVLLVVAGGLWRWRTATGPSGSTEVAMLRVELTATTRSEGEEVVTLPARGRVLLHLHPDAAAPRLQLTLLGPGGAPVAPSAHAGELVVDATTLTEGHYELHAERLGDDGRVVEDLAYYPFRIARHR